MQRSHNKGFALPTVLIASIVLLSILAAAVTATTAVRTSLKTQYYTQLAQAAGEAGVAYAKVCLAENENVPTWSDANPLKPGTDCFGNSVLQPQMDYLIVAGGGSGGSGTGGGGGGGGVKYVQGAAVTTGSFPVVIGNGGASPPVGTIGNNGANSSAFGATVTGGGGGGYSNGAGSAGGGKNGGSGGGGQNYNGSWGSGAGTAGQGFSGGPLGTQSGAGGGGASQAGKAGSGGQYAGGAGGDGLLSSISGTPTYYAGGGGGSSGGAAGLGGATAGGEIAPNATPNSGGGGGGGWSHANGRGGAGGSGVVIISYPNSGSIQATGGNEVYVDGSRKIHKFTSNGTFQVTGVSNSSCPNDPRCFVMQNGNVRSSFSVGMPTVDANGKAVTIPNSGYVEILRSSTGLVWRTYTQPTVQSAVVPDLCSGQATSALGWNNAFVVTNNLTTTDVDDASPIAINSGNSVQPGPQYFRKDFSVATSGAHVLSSAAAANQEIFIDGQSVVSPTDSTVIKNINLDVGCHNIEVRLLNNGLTTSGSELRLTIRRSGIPTSIVRTDNSWRVTAGSLVNFGHQNYYMNSDGWGVVRDQSAALTHVPTWASQSGDSFARFISTTHSASGMNYPYSRYILLRDSRTVVVNSPTDVNVSSLCDDACDVFLDGNLIQSNTWSNVATTTITLTEGSHQFAARLLNTGTINNPAGFALTVKQNSNNAILTRTDNRWLASSTWVTSQPNYSSYHKDYLPVPSDVVVPAIAKVLVVAGGGGGGRNGGGGGGGGGALYRDTYELSVGSTSVVIGTGGAGTGSNTVAGSNGTNSSFGSLVATGGGGGASRDGGGSGKAGGSGGGGGGAYVSPIDVGGAGTSGQGSNGGNGTAPDLGCSAAGGGGGGGGGFGSNGASNLGGNGGAGFISYISGVRVIYGSGGAGGPTCPGSYGIADQNAGAGNGVPGTANTGGGGSGTYNSSNAAGGSGIVIIAYPTGKVTATGGTVTTANGMTIHTFTTNGTFTVTAIN